MELGPLIKNAKNIWLTTHISADGDGIGSEVAFYHSLRELGTSPRLVHNDSAPSRYNFLLKNIPIDRSYEMSSSIFSENDLCFVFDTHDPKLCEPLFSKLMEAKVTVVFIDHHITSLTLLPQCHYILNEIASCTGELTFDLIKGLKVNLTEPIASALYSSLIFDTQNFRHMSNPKKVLAMALSFIEAGADHSLIYGAMFNNWTIEKFNFLAKLIGTVKYQDQDTAILTITQSDLRHYNLHGDDVSDLIDLFMGLKNLKISVVIREEDRNSYKLSFRSRQKEILSWAREFGGGGHLHSAGAWVSDTESNILAKLQKLISQRSA